MANEKDEKLKKDEKPAKADKSSKNSKPAKKDGKGNIFKRIAKFFRDYRSEFKKLVWPSRQQFFKNSAVVLTGIVLFAAVLALLDFGFSQGVKGLFNLVWMIMPR